MDEVHLIGGDDLLEGCIVGGDALERFLAEERCPVGLVDANGRRAAAEQKFLQPEPFSMARLRERLHEIEEETFSPEIALRIAKLKGIELDEEETKLFEEVLTNEVINEEEAEIEFQPPRVVRSQRQPLRYKELKRIDEPRRSPQGPFLVARKVKKQLDPKREDIRTKKPALSDLWDSSERIRQVCSDTSTDKDNGSTVTPKDTLDHHLDALWETTCRHAWSSQAVYDCCMYRPEQPRPVCCCNAL